MEGRDNNREEELLKRLLRNAERNREYRARLGETINTIRKAKRIMDRGGQSNIEEPSV